MERTEIVNSIYNHYDEETRLVRNRHGQLEYLTTMHYIHQMVQSGQRVLEVGAGTGRYSIALAKEGYEVTAVELVAHNLEILRRNAAGLQNLASYQADATDLRMFADNTFDAVLVLGPMYHLYEKADQHKALDEAIRVAKPGGIVMTAFISIYEILYVNYFSGNFQKGMKDYYDSNGSVKHFKEQGFTGFDIEEFENLFAGKPVQKLALAGTDSVLELAERTNGFQMSEEDFELFVKYHLATCEKRELLGSQTHLLYMCRKNR